MYLESQYINNNSENEETSVLGPDLAQSAEELVSIEKAEEGVNARQLGEIHKEIDTEHEDRLKNIQINDEARHSAQVSGLNEINQTKTHEIETEINNKKSEILGAFERDFFKGHDTYIQDLYFETFSKSYAYDLKHRGRKLEEDARFNLAKKIQDSKDSEERKSLFKEFASLYR